MSKRVIVSRIPDCDFCARPARYDAKTRSGAWAYMCATHFRRYGIGLGTGKGQELVLAKPEDGQPHETPRVV